MFSNKIVLVSVTLGLSLGILGFTLIGGETKRSERLVTGSVPPLDRNTPKDTGTATFALGCFWSPDAKFGALPGVISSRVGYSGGLKEYPTYLNLGRHAETVQIEFDPTEITYEGLLDIFWESHDPSTSRVSQYRSMIFVHSERQEKVARESKSEEEAGRGENLVTEIANYNKFYPAENYHQKHFLRQNERLIRAYKSIYPGAEELTESTAVARVNGYMAGYGTLDNLEDLEGLGLTNTGKKILVDIWERKSGSSCSACISSGSSGPENGDNSGYSSDELKEILTPLQYHVTQENGTERAFNNKYWDHHENGIYVDVVSGEPLFSSEDKFRSGTGWPSFTRPINPSNIVEVEKEGLGGTVTEVRSKHANSHLGHVFEDGPEPTGKRYCINSAALRFVPLENLEREGYGEYLHLFGEDGT